MSKNEIRIALAGNPNAGKTTLFNALTGSNQFVGNWPGRYGGEEGRQAEGGTMMSLLPTCPVFTPCPPTRWRKWWRVTT